MRSTGTLKTGQALERIIEASRIEFMTSGPAAAKIDSIAARANLTRQSIYYYYKNKEEIFYDIVTREIEIMVDRFDRLDLETATPEAAIRNLFLGLIEDANQTPILSVFVIDQVCLPGSDKKAKATFTAMIQQIVKRLQTLLDRGAEQGSVRPGVDAARLFAAATMVTCGARNNRHALEMTCGVDLNDAEEMDGWQQFAVDLLMRSIKAVD